MNRQLVGWAICMATILIHSGLHGQTRNFKSTDYTPKQYGINYEARTLAIAQNRLGIMYFGSANGILEHDGANWRHIMVKPGVWVQSIMIDSTGTIYVGAQNEFGYFKNTKNGDMQYVSLSDSLVNEIFPFSDIWKVYQIHGKTLFQSYEYIFLFDGKKTTYIEPTTSFHNSFAIDNEIYVRQREIGLMKLSDKELTMIKNGETFANIGIFGMIKQNDNETLIITYEDGTFLIKNDSITTGNEKINKTLKQTNFKTTNAIMLDSNTLVLGSFNNGFLAIDTCGNIIGRKNINNKLIDNCVNCMFGDREGNLWVTTNKGICNFGNNVNISLYNIDDGIEGSINTIIKFNKRLILGTSNGLFIENIKGNPNTKNLFFAIPGMKKQIWDFCIIKDNLLIGSNDGIYVMDSQFQIEKISNIETNCLCYHSQTDMLLTGGRYGLTIYSHTNGWTKVENLINTQSINGIEIDTSTKDSTIVWLGSNYQGITRIIFNKNWASNITNYTTETDGIEPGRITPVRLNGEILFNSNGHLFKFINENEMVAKLADSLKSIETLHRGAFEDAEQNPIEGIYYITQKGTKTWITTGFNVGYMNNKDSIFIDFLFRGIEMGKINIIYPENEEITWIGATDGLIKYNNRFKTPSVAFNCLITNIKVGNLPTSKWEKNPKIDYKNNSLQFEYVAPWFQYPQKVQYSYILEGLMDTWSEWSYKREAHFQSIREGNYTFKVKARNAFGIVSPEIIYNFNINNKNKTFESSTDLCLFSIKPPWYRSVWAIIVYILATVALIWAIIKYYTHQLAARNLYLEKVIEERTHEIVEQKNQIELKNADLARQNALISSQKEAITDSIKYAERIQHAMLSDINIIRQHIHDAFILFRPRDIVSGDFYWCSASNNKLIVAAVDCTGHGVPGAFMSMLGISYLNLIVNEKRITNTGEIVNMLRENIINSFGEHKEEHRDGMDICIISYDKTENHVQYTGANNPLIVLHKGELIEYKADKMPVGFDEYHKKEFKTNEIKVEKGDCLYLFSDGYCDQFDEQGKKYKKINFKKKLIEINGLDMSSQNKILTETHLKHKGKFDQIDDILVIGLQF